MSLTTRIGRLERAIGTDHSPRRIVVWFGPDFEESWVERHGAFITFHVKVPDHDASPWVHLTAEMRDEIRPGDSMTAIGYYDNGRGSHLQLKIPPWKRRPTRKIDDGRRWEWLDESGIWHPGEEARSSL
jgi:hypothetical protein